MRRRNHDEQAASTSVDDSTAGDVAAVTHVPAPDGYLRPMSTPPPDERPDREPDHAVADSDQRASGVPRVVIFVVGFLVVGMALMLGIFLLASSRS